MNRVIEFEDESFVDCLDTAGEMATLRESYAQKMSELNDELMHVREQCEALQNQLDERALVKQEEREDEEARDEKKSEGKCGVQDAIDGCLYDCRNGIME